MFKGHHFHIMVDVLHVKPIFRVAQSATRCSPLAQVKQDSGRRYALLLCVGMHAMFADVVIL